MSTITQTTTPRVPRFVEIMDDTAASSSSAPTTTKLPISKEGAQTKLGLEQAKEKIEDLSISQPKSNTDSVVKVSEVEKEAGKADQQAPAVRQDEVVSRNQDKVETPKAKIISHSTAGSSAPVAGKRSTVRSKIPSLASTMVGDDLDISFGSLPLRLEMKPICNKRKGRHCTYKPKDELDESPMFICLNCDNRPICTACIKKALQNSTDKHQPDHELRPWKPTSSLQFDKFLWERRHGARLHFGAKELLGREWLYSDHSFAPSSTGNLTVRFNLKAEPGQYNVSVSVSTHVSSSAISKERLGKTKHALIDNGTTWIGSLGVGVQTVDPEITTVHRVVNPCLQGLPDKIVEMKVQKGEDNEETVFPSTTVEISEGQGLEVSIRHWHDKEVFKRGSPFKWWLDNITLTPVVKNEKIAA